MAAFNPFKSAIDALTNANSISEGIATDDLRNFISMNLPKKLKKFVLGVSDAKLGGALTEQLNGLKVIPTDLSLHSYVIILFLSSLLSFPYFDFSSFLFQVIVRIQ